MKTTTISILRSRIKSYIDGVIRDNEPVLINKGTDGAVIISLTDYNRLVSGQVAPMAKEQISIAASSKNDYYVDVNIDEL